jgi:hypothetical protein
VYLNYYCMFGSRFSRQLFSVFAISCVFEPYRLETSPPSKHAGHLARCVPISHITTCTLHTKLPTAVVYTHTVHVCQSSSVPRVSSSRYSSVSTLFHSKISEFFLLLSIVCNFRRAPLACPNSMKVRWETARWETAR